MNGGRSIRRGSPPKVVLRWNQISESNPGISMSSEADWILDGNRIVNCEPGIAVSGRSSAEVTVLGENVVTGSRMHNIGDYREPYSGDFLIRGITWDELQPSGE